MNYYYLSASLPTLSMEEEPSLSQEAFVGLCRQHLSSSDFKALEELYAEKTDRSSSAFIRDWHSAETQLRNAIARKRSANLNTDPERFTKDHSGYNTYIEKAVESAYGKNTPLKRESSLDNFRWKQIEELAGFDMFSNKAIFAYALKLKLALRWASMKDETGAEQIEKIVAQNSDTEEQIKDDGGPE